MKRYVNLLESLPAKTVVFAFGRFNPPTTGHELLIKLVKKLAQSRSADYYVYASATQDKKKNPLSVSQKIHYLKLMFPGTNFVAAGGDQRTFIEVAKYLNKKYKNLVMVAGSDRVPEYQKLLEKYNGTEFHFDSVKVVSAGERDPDADDASGMSASKMRAAAVKGDFATFKKGLPSSVREIDGKRLMNDIREGMGMDAIKEQIILSTDTLREKYFRKEIFHIGDVVESAGAQFEIISRGSNYLTVVDADGETSKKWIHECTIVEKNVSEDISPGPAPAEISFKGYTTKNLHHSADAAKAFQDTIERYGKKDPASVLAALKATDAYMKLNDMHLEQGKAPDETELKTWREAHAKARESLNRIGEFMHHEDYWHMHEHEIQDMEANYNVDTAGAEMADSYEQQGSLIEDFTKMDTPTLKKWINTRTRNALAANLSKERQQQFTQAQAEMKKRKTNEEVELDEAASAAARFNQKVKQAQDAHEAGDHKKAKYHLDNARNFMLGVNSNDHSKLKDSYPKYKELRNLHKEEVDLLEYEGDSKKSDQDHDPAEYKRYHKMFHNAWHHGYMNSNGGQTAVNTAANVARGYQSSDKAPRSHRNALEKARKDVVLSKGAELKEELTDKTIRQGDKVKVARVIADMLGVESAESMSPEIAVNTGLRKIKTKRMTPELLGIVKKMTELATEVGIKFDTNLVPAAMKESAGRVVVDPSKKDNASQDILRYKDFQRLNKASKGVDEDAPEQKPGTPNTQIDGENPTEPGHTLDVGDNDHVRRMKFKYKTEGVIQRSGTDKVTGEDVQTADYKVNPSTGRKSRAHHIDFKNSDGDQGPIGQDLAKDKATKHKKNEPLLKPIGEETSKDDEIQDPSEEEMNTMVDAIQEPEHVLDAYDDEELCIVDSDTGEELDHMKEEVEQINEVLSRMERMKAKIRFARTASKRERRVQLALKTRSSSSKINQRARRLAVNLMKQRIMRKPVGSLTVAEKERAERIIEKRKEAIGRLALKLAPKIRKIENDRLSHSKVTK